jgi:hypothetical protein
MQIITIGSRLAAAADCQNKPAIMISENGAAVRTQAGDQAIWQMQTNAIASWGVTFLP